MLRSTKIVATLGPSSSDPATAVPGRSATTFFDSCLRVATSNDTDMVVPASKTKIIEDTRTSLFTSAAIILAMTVVAFRSLRWGLLCVLPNLFPLLATSALLVAVGEPLRLASAVTFSIALGLADDSAIHFVSAFLRGRRDGLATQRRLRREPHRLHPPRCLELPDEPVQDSELL